MKYCSQCGGPINRHVPTGDTHERDVCANCQTIHYQNPKMVVGCIPEWEDRILLCRRAIEPRVGLWTLPAGFMELNETTAQAAAREAQEEANAVTEIGELYTLYSLPHINQVYLIYRARLLNLDFSPGDESLEVRLFHESDIPWPEMAFPVVTRTLQLYFADRLRGDFRVHHGDFAPPQWIARP
ncbi:MAG TPA: NUDIX hydrolase [Gammaproteobacteria bacterium]|jgi:ADP-ribose pyrophosphatase YjhB (NUDIX family)|nr:NUDIX hydrolase [Gammaproteobacteria bacterium]